MLIRRQVTLHAVVIEGEVVEDPRLSPAALGLFCYLTAASAGRETAEVLARFAISECELDALLAELRTAGHLADDGEEHSTVQPMPPERRRRRYRKPWIPASAKLLMRAIADNADAEGCATPINRHLAEATGQTERNVMRNLAILEGKGLLRRETIEKGDQGNLRLIWVQDKPQASEERLS